MATLLTLKMTVLGAGLWLTCLLPRIWACLCLYLHRSEDSTPSEQIEGHLPEEGIDDILDYLGKPRSESPTVQMA